MDGAFEQNGGGCLAAEAGGAAFPISGTAPWDGLLVRVTIEATCHGECNKGEGDEECDTAIHNCV